MRMTMAELEGLVGDLLVSAGVPGPDARLTAQRLVEADARGRNGHGVIRLVPYLERIRAGGINVDPDIRVLADRPSSAQVDGDNGLGQVVMTRVTDLAIAKAGATGVGVVGALRSNHAGAAGLYALRAAEAGMVGIYLAVANANGMAPWGGRNPLLGTNPLAIAVPGERSTFLLDMATTATSHGTIKTYRDAGRAMPEGWVVGADGEPITDPGRAEEGQLVPMGGYKGAGLTIAIGLLAGVLNGAAFGSDVIDHRPAAAGGRGRRLPPAGRRCGRRRGGPVRAASQRRPGGRAPALARRRLRGCLGARVRARHRAPGAGVASVD